MVSYTGRRGCSRLVLGRWPPSGTAPAHPAEPEPLSLAACPAWPFRQPIPANLTRPERTGESSCLHRGQAVGVQPRAVRRGPFLQPPGPAGSRPCSAASREPGEDGGPRETPSGREWPCSAAARLSAAHPGNGELEPVSAGVSVYPQEAAEACGLLVLGLGEGRSK